MIKYPEQPDNVPIPRTAEGHIYKMRRGYYYEDKDIVCEIKPGWLYDGASVPRTGSFVSGIFPDGLIRAAAAVHDVFYENSGHSTLIKPHPYFRLIFKDRKLYKPARFADAVFLRIYRQSGEDMGRVRAAYLAVRAFGVYPENRGTANHDNYN